MSRFNKKDFGENLRNIRKKLGLTQENLAYALKVTSATVSRYESGDILPDIEQVSILCDEFGIYVNELLNTSTKIINKENSKNPFKTKELYIYYKGIYPAKNKPAKLKFRLDIIENPECIEVNFSDCKTNKIYMSGYMLADSNVAIIILENYKSNSPRLEVTKIVINISNNLNGLMKGTLSATNGQYVPNERKCIISKENLEFSNKMLEMIKVTDKELENIKELDAWYMNIDNIDDYEE